MSNDLIIIEEIKNPIQVFSADKGLDSFIDKIEHIAKSIDRDISTSAGRETIRKIAADIARNKNRLYELGQQTKADAQITVTMVNKENSRAWDRMEALQAEIRKPLTDWEDAEKKRVEDHEARLTAMDMLVSFQTIPSVADITTRSEQLNALHKDRDWEEFSARALQSYDRISKSIADLLADKIRSEAEHAELERLRAEKQIADQKARDEAVAADATRKAEEKAAQEKTEREAEVERERQAAALREENERKAKENLEKRRVDGLMFSLETLGSKDFFEDAPNSAAVQARIDVVKDYDKIDWQEFSGQAQQAMNTVRGALDKMMTDAVERERVAAEESLRISNDQAAQRERDRVAAEKVIADKAQSEREADLEHKKKINNESMDAIIAIIMATIENQNAEDPARIAAMNIIKSIARGSVPHVSIKY